MMKAPETKSKKAKNVAEKKYVIVDGKKVSKTWAAIMENLHNPGIEIVDKRAVLK